MTFSVLCRAGLSAAGLIFFACSLPAQAAPLDRFTQPYAEPAAPIPDLQQLQQRAESGQAEAQYQLGLAYQLGAGLERNFVQARLWFNRAAQQGHARAQGGLAFLLMLGQGGPKDLPEAETLLQQAADQGEPSALANLAEVSLELRPAKPQEALDLLERAIAAGAINARYRLARLLIEGKRVIADVPRGLKLLEEAAAAGSVYGQTYLAALLIEGEVLPRDETRAFQLARRAADAGFAEGLNEFGLMIARGMGTAPDPRRGATYLERAGKLGDPNGWYNLALLHQQALLDGGVAEARRFAVLAASQSHLSAQAMAGRMLYRGEGGASDAAAALVFLRPAAEAGDADSQNYLALILFNGEGGVAADQTAAMDWWERGVAQNHGPSTSNFATYLADGKGRPADLARARRLLETAAEHGHAPAQFRWALWQEQGWKSTPKDLAGAIRWFRRAAESGHAAAAFKYASYLEAGEGVAANQSEALRWYRAAAEDGNAAAQFQMARLLFGGDARITADRQAAITWLERAARQAYPEALFVLGDLHVRGDGRAADPMRAWIYFRLAEERGVPEAGPNRRIVEARLLPAERLQAIAAARQIAAGFRRESIDE